MSQAYVCDEHTQGHEPHQAVNVGHEAHAVLGRVDGLTPYGHKDKVQHRRRHLVQEDVPESQTNGPRKTYEPNGGVAMSVPTDMAARGEKSCALTASLLVESVFLSRNPIGGDGRAILAQDRIGRDCRAKSRASVHTWQWR